MDLAEQAARFRAAARERAEFGPRVKYTAVLRAQAVAYGKARVAEGAVLALAARELGMDERTLKRWSAVTVQAGLRFRRVEVQQEATPPPTPGRLVLIGPGGLRWRGWMSRRWQNCCGSCDDWLDAAGEMLAYTAPVDIRRAFDALTALVTQVEAISWKRGPTIPRKCGSADAVTPRTAWDLRHRSGPDDRTRRDRNPSLSADRLHHARCATFANTHLRG